MKKMVSFMMSAALMLTSVPVQVYAEDVDTEIVAEETELVTEESTAPLIDAQDITEASTETILLQEIQAPETETLSDVESENGLVTQPETEAVSETESENITEAWSEVPTETDQESETAGIVQSESELLSESERMTEADTEPVSESAYTEDEELIIKDGDDISYGIEQIDLEDIGVMAAEEDAATGFTYKLLEDGTAEITGYTGEQTGDLIIPDEVDGHKVTSIGNDAFYGCDGFTGGLVIPERVTSIGDDAFSNCRGFTGELHIPERVTSIGDDAFYYCSGFTGELKLPEGLVSIGDRAFSGCAFTGKFALPTSLVDVGENLFADFNWLVWDKDPSITLDTVKYLMVGAQGKLQVEGWRADPAWLSWKSNHEDVLTVDANGVVKAVGAGQAMITVTAITGDSGTQSFHVIENKDIFYYPTEEKFDDLWVGDEVLIGMVYDNSGPVNGKNIKSVSVVNGNADIKMGGGFATVRLTQPGDLSLEIAYNDLLSGENKSKRLELHVSKRPTEIKVDVPESIKLGGIGWMPSIKSENMPYGVMPSICAKDEDAEHFYIHYDGFGWGGWFPVNSRNVPVLNNFAHGVTYPGKVQMIVGDENGNKDLSIKYSVTIEEPVIVSNEKPVVQTGNSLNLEVNLTNTDYEDFDIEERKAYLDYWKTSENGEVRPSDYYDKQDSILIYYTPKLEIISGADCCELESDQTLTTLSLKQKLKFTKKGTVKLKVTYVPSGTDAARNNVYQPEKIITINVVDELETEAPETEPQKQTEAPVAEVKVSSVAITTTDLSVQKGKTLQLTATVKPGNAKNRALVWSSSNTSIATVNAKGVVTGKKYGTATITAKAADGSGKSVRCKVRVGYGITYKLNGGKNSTENPRAYYKSAVKLQNPTRKGYLFKGWYTDKKYKKKITKIASSSKKNLTLYAKWEKVKTGKAAISSLKNVAGKKATLKFKKVSKASGYEILYGTAKNLKGAKTVTSKETTVTLKGLTKGKTYYVKVRAYRTDSAGSKVYGKYSGVKRVKITK